MAQKSASMIFFNSGMNNLETFLNLIIQEMTKAEDKKKLTRFLALHNWSFIII